LANKKIVGAAVGDNVGDRVVVGAKVGDRVIICAVKLIDSWILLLNVIFIWRPRPAIDLYTKMRHL
jgi:hypothetical protein